MDDCAAVRCQRNVQVMQRVNPRKLAMQHEWRFLPHRCRSAGQVECFTLLLERGSERALRTWSCRPPGGLGALFLGTWRWPTEVLPAAEALWAYGPIAVWDAAGRGGNRGRLWQLRAYCLRPVSVGQSVSSIGRGPGPSLSIGSANRDLTRFQGSIRHAFRRRPGLR